MLTLHLFSRLHSLNNESYYNNECWYKLNTICKDKVNLDFRKTPITNNIKACSCVGHELNQDSLATGKNDVKHECNWVCVCLLFSTLFKQCTFGPQFSCSLVYYSIHDVLVQYHCFVIQLFLLLQTILQLITHKYRQQCICPI